MLDYLYQTYRRQRYRVGALFSSTYATRLRWLQEEPFWLRQGVAHPSLRSNAIFVQETGAIYLAVAKAANSSIKTALAKNVTPNPGDVASLPSILDAGLTLNDLMSGNYVIFTVVRNPIARFWSAFGDKIMRKRGGKLEQTIRSTLGLPKSTVVTPDHVLSYVESSRPTEVDQHFMPQWSATGIRLLPVSHLARVENLRGDISRLEDLGVVPPGTAKALPHLRASPEVARIRGKEKYRERISRIYRDDFELFGYALADV